MADDRMPCRRSESIVATKSDKVMSRPLAISFSPFQNASSRLTLVLWPAITIERLITGDFIASLPFQSGAGRERGGPSHRPFRGAFGRTWFDRSGGGWQPPAFGQACAWRPYA